MQDIIRLVIGPGAVLNPGIIGFRPRTMAEHAQNRLHGIRGGSSGRTCQDGCLRDGRSGLGRSGMAGNEVSCPKDSLGRPFKTSLALVAMGFINLIKTYPNEQISVGQVPTYHFLLRIAVYPLAGITVPTHELPRFRVNFHNPRNIRRNRRTDKAHLTFQRCIHNPNSIKNELAQRKKNMTNLAICQNSSQSTNSLQTALSNEKPRPFIQAFSFLNLRQACRTPSASTKANIWQFSITSPSGACVNPSVV